MDKEKFNRCRRAINDALMEMYGMGWDKVLADRTRRRDYVQLRAFIYKAVTDRLFLLEREQEKCFGKDRCSIRHGLASLEDGLRYDRSLKEEWKEFNDNVKSRFMYYTTKYILADGSESTRIYESKKEQMADLANLMSPPFRFITVCND